MLFERVERVEEVDFETEFKKERNTIYLAKLFPPLRRRERGEHHLSNVEGVAPVVVRDPAVVLPDRGQPPAEDGVVDVKAPQKVQINEHSKCSLKGKIF